jgi:hypothetical protein
MGTGATIDYFFSSEGARTITVTATDKDGNKSTDQIVVHTRPNEPPSAIIESPANGTKLIVGATYEFRGDGRDPESVLFLPCDRLSWSTSLNDTFSNPHSCNPEVTFLTAGPRFITLIAEDSEGLHGATTILVFAERAVAGAPPEVSILSPHDTDLFTVGDSVTAKGSATGVGPLQYEWRIGAADGRVIRSGTIAQSGTFNFKWTPSVDIPVIGCGGKIDTLFLVVTDANGKVSSDSVPVRVISPPC